MKIHGQELGRPNVETLVFPRADDKEIVFKLQSILDMEVYEEQYPSPNPPLVRRKGESAAKPDYDDKKYQAKMTEYGKMKSHWMLLKSLEATEGIEWEQVKPNEPQTWQLIEKELKDSGLNQIEVMRLYQAMMRVNSLDEDYLQEARDRFFESQQEKQEPEEK
jgi:hypothetical protein